MARRKKIYRDKEYEKDLRREKIREYVKNGGKIIANFDSSLYNETCKIRDEFALSDVFGVSYKKTIKYAGA